MLKSPDSLFPPTMYFVLADCDIAGHPLQSRKDRLQVKGDKQNATKTTLVNLMLWDLERLTTRKQQLLTPSEPASKSYESKKRSARRYTNRIRSLDPILLFCLMLQAFPRSRTTLLYLLVPARGLISSCLVINFAYSS